MVEPKLPFIAHAGGGLDGKTYLNCRECFLKTYELGTRLFEFDFMMTSDHHVVAMHDGKEKDYGLPSPPERFTLEQYQKSRNSGTTPLTEYDVARLMLKYPDWLLVTDVKDDNTSALGRLCAVFAKRGIDCKERVIPQVYSPDELAQVNPQGYRRIILTLYRFGNRKDEVLSAIRAHRPWAITMWDSWWDPEWRELLAREQVLGLVHTVNDGARAKQLLDAGVSGIYTDTLH